MELQVYREFLNGSRTFAIDEWTGLLDTHERFRKTFLNATQLGNLGSALVIHDLLMADFPHVWFAEYQEILPRIKARTTADGRFTGSISIRPRARGQSTPRGNEDIFKSVLLSNHRTTELGELS